MGRVYARRAKGPGTPNRTRSGWERQNANRVMGKGNAPFARVRGRVDVGFDVHIEVGRIIKGRR